MRSVTQQSCCEPVPDDPALLLRLHQAATPALTLVWDQARRQVEWLAGPVEDLLGYAVDGGHWREWAWLLERIHPGDWGIFRERVLMAREGAGGQGFLLERRLRIRHAGGSWRHFQARVVPFPSAEAGAEERLYCILTEITEHQRERTALIRSEQRLRALMEQSSDLVSILDVRGRLTYNSPAGERLLGYRKREFIGRDIFSIMHPEDRPAARRAFARLLADPEQPQTLQCRYLTREGSWIWMESVGLNRVHHPAIRGLVVNSRDVTERKRLEREILDSLTKYRDLAELLPEAVYEADEAGRLIFANQWGLKMFGFDPADIGQGLEIRDWVAPEDRERLTDMIEEGLRIGGGHHVRQVTALRRSGERFPVSIHAAPVMKDGRAIGHRGILVDLTAQRQAEEEREQLRDRIRQGEKMEAVGQLAGGIAHDYNNQLSAIMGFAELLREQLNGGPLTRYAEHIISGCRRSAELTRQLLAFARKGQYRQESIAVDDLVGDLVQILEHSFDKRIVIEHRACGEVAFLTGDPNQIQSALMNLAINARDAMPEGGELVFDTGFYDLGEEEARALPYAIQHGRFVRIRVTDTGIGMTQEVLGHIFEPFFTTKELGKGTGLGLASVYGIVKNHRGFIQVESAPGAGSSFCILFPAAISEAVPEESGETRPQDSAVTRILLVEDEPMVAETVSQMLGRVGCKVELARDGEEALSVFRERGRDFDLVILDMVMPRMGGRDVFRALKAMQPDVKVLLSSGYSIQGDAQQVMSEGASGFLQKPYLMKDLVRAVQDALALPC